MITLLSFSHKNNKKNNTVKGYCVHNRKRGTLVLKRCDSGKSGALKRNFAQLC